MVDSNYVYEHAIKDDNGNYTTYSHRRALDLSQLRIILALQTDWLKQIKVSGTTQNIVIKEQQALEAIRTAGILPPEHQDLLSFQYRIRNTPTWFDREQFIAHLATLGGAKDKANFILRREELEVRFGLKPDYSATYGLKIDGTDITEANRDAHNVQLVDDEQNHNSTVRGYINLDKLPEFAAANFSITGSNVHPVLNISKRLQLDAAFQPYASAPIFKVLLSTTQDQAGHWL